MVSMVCAGDWFSVAADCIIFIVYKKIFLMKKGIIFKNHKIPFQGAGV
jgi:hypothetical protein